MAARCRVRAAFRRSFLPAFEGIALLFALPALAAEVLAHLQPQVARPATLIERERHQALLVVRIGPVRLERVVVPVREGAGDPGVVGGLERCDGPYDAPDVFAAGV